MWLIVNFCFSSPYFQFSCKISKESTKVTSSLKRNSIIPLEYIRIFIRWWYKKSRTTYRRSKETSNLFIRWSDTMGKCLYFYTSFVLSGITRCPELPGYPLHNKARNAFHMNKIKIFFFMNVTNKPKLQSNALKW